MVSIIANTNNIIQHYSFISTQLNGSKVLLSITNNSIKHQSFVYTKLNDQIVLFQAIQFSKSYLFALSLNVKQFYLTQR